MIGGRALPEAPNLRTATERTVWKALRSQLAPGEVLLSSVRFSDARNGDVEADFIVLIPELGAAVIEVKGGTVRFEDGQWTTKNGTYQRRIHPVEQARKAKHALRRYLDRQPDWQHPLLRTEWFLALPATDVEGDLSPEARRDLLFDRSDVDTMLPRIRMELASTLNSDHVPDSEWVETALTLLLRQVQDQGASVDIVHPLKNPTKVRALMLGLIVVNAFAAYLATVTLSGPGTLAVCAFTLSATCLIWWLVGHQHVSLKTLLKVPLTPLVGIVIGIVLGVFATNGNSLLISCDSNYEPCVPVSEDVNCSELTTQVVVTGEDVYQLDRDGDGIACESLPLSKN